MSSPTPAVDIKSSKRKKFILYGVGIVLAVFAILSPSIFYQLPTTNLLVSGKTISLEIASSETAQAKGLGGRSSLATDKGMLFTLAKPAKQCIWMKVMRFPIDAMWLSGSRQVVDIEQNIAPRTSPKKFCPDNAAKYIIELNAGQVDSLGIRQCQTLKFE